jgi:hypothetical protein
MQANEQFFHWAADPVAFAKGALNFTCDPWQEKVLRSTKDGLICIHRQAGKSTTTGIAAVHKAKFTPGSQTLILAPSGRQSTRMFATVRRFVKMLEPTEVLEADNRMSCEFSNGSSIIAIPGANPDTIRGFVPDLIIEDEASWVLDETHEACAPMLLVTKGRHILLSTPGGARGHFHAHFTSGNPDWERFTLSVLDNPRIDKEQLEKLRRKTPEWMWRQEYLVHWLSSYDQMFSDDLINSAFDDRVKPIFTREQIAQLTT